MRLTAILFILFLAFRSAGISPGDTLGIYVSGTTSTPADGIRIAWDRSSLQKLSPFDRKEPGWAGYPRLRRLSDGQTLVVYETGRNFGMLTRPFEVPLDREAKWSSISLWDENTIAAVATTSFQSRHPEVWMILGHIIPELKAENKKVTIDGHLQEWNGNFPVFIGSRFNANLSAAVSFDEKNLFFVARIKGKNLNSNPQNPSGSSGVYFYIDAGNHNLTNPGQGLFKVWCNNTGDTRIYKDDNGTWKEICAKGMKSAVLPDEEGYRIELAIPFSSIRKADRPDIRITIGLKGLTDDGTEFTEHIVHTNPGASSTWLKVELENEFK